MKVLALSKECTHPAGVKTVGWNSTLSKIVSNPSIRCTVNTDINMSLHFMQCPEQTDTHTNNILI